jgi:hypothetical protein
MSADEFAGLTMLLNFPDNPCLILLAPNDADVCRQRPTVTGPKAKIFQGWEQLAPRRLSATSDREGRRIRALSKGQEQYGQSFDLKNLKTI